MDAIPDSLTGFDFSRYTVKIISSSILLEETFLSYDSSWTMDSMSKKKDPLILTVTGTMKQQPAIASFLGRGVEEKFHMTPMAIHIIPCIPLVSNRVKEMVHPDVGPTQISEGIKDGYFYVDLSLKQNFDIGPGFFESLAQNDMFGTIFAYLQIIFLARLR
jgi:hypothetical protein